MENTKGMKAMMESYASVIILKAGEKDPRKAAKESEIIGLKIKQRLNNKLTTSIPCDRDLIKKVKSIPKENGNPKGKNYDSS